jgi:sugar/nucleoside kinase (ribokinase family)
MATKQSPATDQPTGATTGEGSMVFFGSHAVDYYFKCACWPKEGQKINAQPAGRTYGGMIPNAVSIFAGYGQTPLLLGPLENNDDAAPIIAELTAAGVDTRFVRQSPDFKNSYAYNFLTDENPGEKTLIIVDPGYAFEMTDAERRVVRSARSIYSTIAHLGRIRGASSLIAEARRQGAKLFIDVEAESFRSAEEEWWAFSAADFISFNEESLSKFCRGRGTEEAVVSLLRATGGEVITTLGSEGCEVVSATEKVRMPGIKVAAVDPLGAGDTFNATYLFGRMSGWPIARAARFANAAAARSTTMFGPRSGRASVQAVETFLRNLETPAAAAAFPASAGSG